MEPPRSKLDLIRATFPTLDTWGAAASSVFVPEAGSDLSKDDTDWPWNPVSQVAITGLSSARDHLKAVRVHIKARQLFPFAESTLIRAALIGAAQAVWVLAPDAREVRLERARCVASYGYAQYRSFLAELQKLPPVAHEGTDSVAAHVELRRRELAAKRAADDQKATLNTTAMIEQAAVSTFGMPAVATEVLSIWRLTSGAAHGFVWALMGEPDIGLAGDAECDGLATFTAGGDIDRITNEYMCAFRLAEHGWSLLHARGTASPDTPNAAG